jgi:hypothetical protein
MLYTFSQRGMRKDLIELLYCTGIEILCSNQLVQFLESVKTVPAKPHDLAGLGYAWP